MKRIFQFITLLFVGLGLCSIAHAKTQPSVVNTANAPAFNNNPIASPDPSPQLVADQNAIYLLKTDVCALANTVTVTNTTAPANVIENQKATTDPAAVITGNSRATINRSDQFCVTSTQGTNTATAGTNVVNKANTANSVDPATVVKLVETATLDPAAAFS